MKIFIESSVRLTFMFVSFVSLILIGQAQQKRGVEIVQINEQGKSENIKLYDGSYALVIGETDYAGGWRKLPGVRSDVEAVKAALEKHNFQVKVLMNLKRDELIGAIDSFVGDYGYSYDNRLIIYFAGHGETLPSLDGRAEQGFIIPLDAPSKTDADFRRKAVSMETIGNFADQIQAKHTLFVFDSCFSGKLVMTRGDIKITPFIAENVSHSIKQFITSGSANEPVSDAGDFRNFFVRALDGEADLDEDGFILGSELASYLKREMNNFTARSNIKQSPQFNQYTLDSSKIAGDFVFFVGGMSRKTIKVSSRNTADQTTTKKSETSSITDNPDQSVVKPKLDTVTAQSILDRAAKARTGSMQGQVEAIESLLASGYEFNSADFRGVSFRGANLGKGKFGMAKLHAVDFTETNAQEADFTEAGLRFANLERAVLKKAIFSESYSPFVVGRQADFENAVLSGANFFGADFRGANFRNAKMRGVSLAFADLRGAIFDGADLTGAYLVGAILDGKTTFVGATIENTDFLGASADSFSLSQKQKNGTCRHEIFLKDADRKGYIDWNINLLEERASDRFSTGYEFEKIVQDKWMFTNFNDRSLRSCTTPVDAANSFDARFPGDLQIHLDREVVNNAGWREAFRKRVEEHRKLLNEMLSENKILKGSAQK